MTRLSLALFAALAALAATDAAAGARPRPAHTAGAAPAPPAGQRDYPGSNYVITRQMMDDMQARSVCDALRFAPGVAVGGCR